VRVVAVGLEGAVALAAVVVVVAVAAVEAAALPSTEARASCPLRGTRRFP